MATSFPYRGKLRTMLLVALFFGGGAAFFAHKAATNDRGLIVNGLIELGPTGATVFYVVFAVVSGLFVVLAGGATLYGHLKQTVLVLADDHLEIPGGFFKRHVRRVEFASITSASLQKINGQEFLILQTAVGQASIARSLLSPDHAFDRIVAAVEAREPPPTDPQALHDLLYRQASDSVQPHLIFHDQPKTNPTDASTRAVLEKAIGQFEQVLALNPENWPAAWLAGKAAQRLADQERAYRFFARAFARQKENPNVARELMLTCLDTRRAAEAVTVAEHAVRIDATDPGLKANLALARLCAGDLAGAETAIAAAVEGDPRDAISLAVQRIIGEVKRGERKPPQTPADLER